VIFRGWSGIDGAFVRNFGILITRERNQDHPELGPHSVGRGKDIHYLGGRCIGGHVIIRGRPTEQKVAHASADEKCLVAAFAQRAHNVSRESFLIWHGSIGYKAGLGLLLQYRVR
jgi:hypothetical protein